MEKPGFGQALRRHQSASARPSVLKAACKAGIIEECDLHRIVGG